MEPFAAARGQLVALGDSLTQYGFSPLGWLSLLADHYSRKLDVLNRGYSGYNTTCALYMLQRSPHLLPPSPSLTLILFGANDSSNGPWQHVPVSQYVSNLRDICALLLSTSSSLVMLVTPPMVDAKAWDAHCEAQGKPTGTRSNAQVVHYAQAVRALASELALPLADLHGAMQAREDWRDLLCDGLHLSEGGNKLLAEVVLGAIGRDIPQLASSAVLLDAPLWSEFDASDCKGSWDAARTRR
jgi:lysophospholipase L1-like esterase